MTQTQLNKDAVLHAFDMWTEGRGDIRALFARDLTWQIVGESAAAGDYTRDGIVTLMDDIDRHFTRHGAVKPIRVRLAVAEGDWVIVVWDGTGLTDAGASYNNTYAWCMRLENGLIVDVVAFYDSIAFDRMWAVTAS